LSTSECIRAIIIAKACACAIAFYATIISGAMTIITAFVGTDTITSIAVAVLVLVTVFAVTLSTLRAFSERTVWIQRAEPAFGTVAIITALIGTGTFTEIIANEHLRTVT
jgi:hypothetical protein